MGGCSSVENQYIDGCDEKKRKEILIFIQTELEKCTEVIERLKSQEEEIRAPRLIFLANSLDILFPFGKAIEEQKERYDYIQIEPIINLIFVSIWNFDKDKFYYYVEQLDNQMNRKEENVLIHSEHTIKTPN